MAGNLHAVGLILEDSGVLITGPSGSGKTSLALALIGHCRCHGLAAMLVADDQLLVLARGARLIAEAPRPIFGLAEARGFGPAPIAAEARMVADLVVELVEPSAAPRIAEEGAVKEIAGCPVSCLRLPARDTHAAVMAVAARLGLAPFRPGTGGAS